MHSTFFNTRIYTEFIRRQFRKAAQHKTRFSRRARAHSLSASHRHQPACGASPRRPNLHLGSVTDALSARPRFELLLSLSSWERALQLTIPTVDVARQLFWDWQLLREAAARWNASSAAKTLS
jgi:hypothetical protein